MLCKLNMTGSRKPLPNEMMWVNTDLRWHDTFSRNISFPFQRSGLLNLFGRGDAVTYSKHSTKISKVFCLFISGRPSYPCSSVIPCGAHLTGFITSRSPLLCCTSPAPLPSGGFCCLHLSRPSSRRPLKWCVCASLTSRLTVVIVYHS